MNDPIWIDEASVRAHLTLTDAIDAVRAVLIAQAAGTARAMPKSVLALSNGGSLHALGGELVELGFAGTKTWSHTPGGAQPLVVLSHLANGRVAAVIEAFSLGQFRTSATTAVATDLMSMPDATVLAMFGTGKQAFHQVAAVVAVRPIQLVNVWGRDAERRAHLARRVEYELGVEAQPCDDVTTAAAGADVITLATRATSPVIKSDAVKPGAHVNAIGAVTPERAEFDPALLDRCAAIVADSVEQARALASELRQRFGDDEQMWSSVMSLSESAASGFTRQPDADVTLFKSLGLGLSDLAIGQLVLQRVSESGDGYHPLPRYEATHSPSTSHEGSR